MRHWHPVLIKAVVHSLQDVFVGGFYADKVLHKNFRENKKWGSKDRKFIAETLYDMVRWWGFLAAIDDRNLSPKEEKSFVRRWSIYESWAHNVDVTNYVVEKLPEYTDMVLSYSEVEDRLESLDLSVWEKNSFPEWIYKKFESQYGKDTEKLVEELNEPAPVFLRVNTLKSDSLKVIAALASEDVFATAVEGIQTCLKLSERKNVFATKAFKDGWFEVQDGASQRVALMLDVKPGERVADVCAGAGGKTLHLAALMKNKGMLLAGDVYEKKLTELKDRAARAGVSNLRVQLFENSKDLKRHREKFDALLIDAPCSGSGVFRRNPDSKWKMGLEELDRLKLLQAKVLEDYSKFLRPGGRMVYATCSLWTEENEEQIENFILKFPEFEKVGEPLVTRPDQSDEDGFFAQKLIRKG